MLYQQNMTMFVTNNKDMVFMYRVAGLSFLIITILFEINIGIVSLSCVQSDTIDLLYYCRNMFLKTKAYLIQLETQKHANNYSYSYTETVLWSMHLL